jgi:multiple sugar transport system ATP-binding protein
MSDIQLNNIQKSYGSTEVIKNINLDINKDEFIVLVGPSGCGKSTLLRMIAGLEEISGGELKIAGEDHTKTEPKKRGVAMVFQDYALYPHMTVYENMSFGLEISGVEQDEIKSRVGRAADILDLTSYLERKPAALSGGQRQRVAMGRAIVKNSSVFLYDEPLSNLDAKLRSKMRSEIKRFHQKNHATAIYVTHDQLEAMTLADRLVILNKGSIEQIGTPMEVYEKPRTLFVADFIGSPGMNFFNVTIEDREGKLYVTHDGEGFSFPLPPSKVEMLNAGDQLKMGIRPSDVYIKVDENLHDWETHGTVEFAELLGKNAYVNFKVGDTICVGDISGINLPQVDSQVPLNFNLNFIHFFDKVTGQNILF